MIPLPVHQKSDLNVAFLPGVGRIVDPQPGHYRRAIAHLKTEMRRAPLPQWKDREKWERDPRAILAERLWDTLHRIEWGRRE